jgi:uncharacterized protein YbaR (Trm112 family)
MCPKCKGQDLKVDVVIHTRARLIQETDGNFQTDSDGGDHEWDNGGMMECCDCGHEAKVSAFRVPDDYPAMLKLIQQLARMNYDGEEINPGHEAKVSAFRVPDDYPAMLKLIQQLARMNYDGEEINPGHDDIEEFDMSGDDASEALSGCIKEAREILGEE